MKDHPTLHHPIIAAALTAHGLTEADVTRSDAWRGLQIYTHYIDADGTPVGGMSSTGRGLSLSRDKAEVEWPKGRFEMIRQRKGWETNLRLWRFAFPETIAAIIPGRMLSGVIVLPGADGIRILSITNGTSPILHLEVPS